MVVGVSSSFPFLSRFLPPSLFLLAVFSLKDDRASLRKQQILWDLTGCSSRNGAWPQSADVRKASGTSHAFLLWMLAFLCLLNFLTRSYPVSTAESATYCLVKNAVKMFKDIGVSAHHLQYKVVSSVLFPPRSSLSEPPLFGVGPEKSSFCWTNHDSVSGDWERAGYAEGEAHQYRFIWMFQNFADFLLHPQTVYIQQVLGCFKLLVQFW